MNIPHRLRTCAKHTGLDAVIELLNEAADEIDALQARAILALRPERVPMTDGQIRSMCKQGWVFETVKQWVRIIEAHHGISAQAKKGDE